MGIGFSTSQNPTTGVITTSGPNTIQFVLNNPPLPYPNIRVKFTDNILINYNFIAVLSYDYQGQEAYFTAYQDGLFWEILINPLGPTIYYSYSGFYNCQNINGYGTFNTVTNLSEAEIKTKINEFKFKKIL